LTKRGSFQPDCSLPRAGSKLADVMRLLGRKQGAGIEELTSATGWLPHTTRAALTGLRKRGFAVERLRSEQGGSELCLNLGDGVNQAANLASSTTSIPSRNLAPLTTFGNWF
jgi:DNA-binding IclR family transcriptional regulator